MSVNDRQETRFSSEVDPRELDEYRELSRLAIVALIVAVFSVLAIVHPLLWIAPVLGFVLSTLSLRQLSRPESPTGGKAMSAVALCLSLFFLAYAPTRAISHERMLYQLAQDKATSWLELLRTGRVQEAHQLSLPQMTRHQGSDSLEEYYQGAGLPSSPPDTTMLESAPPSPPPSSQLEGFKNLPLVAKILEYGTSSEIRFVGDIAQQGRGNETKITQRFTAAREQGGRTESFDFLVHTTRTLISNHAEWHVGELSEPRQ